MLNFEMKCCLGIWYWGKQRVQRLGIIDLKLASVDATFLISTQGDS